MQSSATSWNPKGLVRVEIKESWDTGTFSNPHQPICKCTPSPKGLLWHLRERCPVL